MKLQPRFLYGALTAAILLLPSGLRAGQKATSEERISSTPGQAFHLNEIGFGSGYAWGRLERTGQSLAVVPAYVRLGFDMNPLVCMPEGGANLQFALEPFVNTVTEPDNGVEAGVELFIRYLHPVTPTVRLVSEIGSGPMYFSIDTREQGEGGFNFLNQLGLGAQVSVSRKSALTFGYRFRHLSNGGTRQPNSGINSNAMGISYSLLR